MSGTGPFSVLAVGLISGWIAQRIVDRRLSLWACLCLGLLGAVCGNAIGRLLQLELSGLAGALVLTVTGSVLVLALYVLIRRGR